MSSSESSTSAEQDFSQRVWSVLKGSTSPVCTGGWLTLETAPTITHDGESFPIEPATKKYEDGYRIYGDKLDRLKLTRQCENLQGLVEKIPQASFGQGKETVYDTSIRDALQLKADDFQVDIPQDKMDGILEKIKKDLHLKTDISAERYSLNVYQKGGKFLKHKDTPRGEDMLGTLVVCLPSLFKGGYLTVTMGTIKSTYFKYGNYGDAKGGSYEWWQNKPSSKLLWSAFFADVDHERDYQSDRRTSNDCILPDLTQGYAKCRIISSLLS